MRSMEYKGFTGSIGFSQTDDVFFGKVNNVRDMVSYEAKELDDLEHSFREAIDDWLQVKEANAKYDVDNLFGM